MGCYSWKDCKDSKKRIICGKLATSYLLIPEEFGGGHHVEPCYDGFGMFGLVDVYEEVAIWNRSHLSSFSIPYPSKGNYANEEYYNGAIKRYNNGVAFLNDFAEGVKSDEEMCEIYGNDYLREIGILIACEDKDNFSIKYPIKITYDETAVYENCKPSKSDPMQGCY